MNKERYTQSAAANDLIRKSSDLQRITGTMLAGVAIVAVSLLAACQSPLAISPVVADAGSVQNIVSSSSANEIRVADPLRYEPNMYLEYIKEISPQVMDESSAGGMFSPQRSDTENVMDEHFEMVVTVDDSAAVEMYLLQRSDSENIMDEAFEITAAATVRNPELSVSEDVQAMAERDANYQSLLNETQLASASNAEYVITPDGWFENVAAETSAVPDNQTAHRSMVESDSTYQYYSILAEIRAQEAASAAGSATWVGDGHLIRWKPAEPAAAPVLSDDENAYRSPVFGDQQYIESAAAEMESPE